MLLAGKGWAAQGQKTQNCCEGTFTAKEQCSYALRSTRVLLCAALDRTRYCTVLLSQSIEMLPHRISFQQVEKPP